MQQEQTASTSMNRNDRRNSLRHFNWNAGMRSMFDTVCGGTTFIFVAFARSLGLAREQMGWMTFLISTACVVQMVGLPLISRAGNKKRFALTLALVEPALVIAAVILALLLPAPFRFTAFAAAVFTAAAFVHLSRPVTDDWLATLIPSGIRGRYLGRLVDRWGARRALYLIGILYILFFATFLFCGPGRYWPLMAAWAMVALADGTFSLAFQSALYASIPDTTARPAYFAVNNFVTISLFGLGGAIAVPLLQSIKEFHLVLGPLTLGNLHLLYGCCALLMIPCLFSAALIEKEEP